jgi:hypothetical protein
VRVPAYRTKRHFRQIFMFKFEFFLSRERLNCINIPQTSFLRVTKAACREAKQLHVHVKWCHPGSF